jgi:hypothetical protein
MKTVKKNVYYCDFCKKRSLSAGAMRKHEKHCTANLNRECGLCKEKYDYMEIIETLKKRYNLITTEYDGFTSCSVEWIEEPLTIEEIKDLVEGCPACTLTIIRKLDDIIKIKYNELNYNYKHDVTNWWNEKNKEEDLYDMRHYPDI